MKRFQFQLDPLLRLRSQAKQLAEMRQAQAQMQLETAQSHVRELQAEMAATCELGIQKMVQTGTLDQYLQHQRFLETLQRAIVHAQGNVQAAETNYRIASDACRLLAVQVESLETLREVRRDEHREQVMSHTQNQLDEHVMRKWGVRDRTSGSDQL